jgi:pyruvate,water dikinase
MADGHLTDARDIFYLEVDEVLGFLAGTATATDLKGLTSLRKAQFAAFHEAPTPPSRIATRGSPFHSRQQIERPAADGAITGDLRRGVSCCPGLIRGTARVVRDPKRANLRKGDILVAEQTDPGWVLLFAGAAGLLVERGSVLSHSAIVARELQIPTIVSIPGLTNWLEEGDDVEMNATTGTVQRLERKAPHSASAAVADVSPFDTPIMEAQPRGSCYAR